jgi:hypothetical protein
MRKWGGGERLPPLYSDRMVGKLDEHEEPLSARYSASCG